MSYPSLDKDGLATIPYVAKSDDEAWFYEEVGGIHVFVKPKYGGPYSAVITTDQIKRYLRRRDKGADDA